MGRETIQLMLYTAQSTIIVVLTVAASLLFMWALNRIWPWDKRHAHNDMIGWQLSILGTTYAVILGFMLYTVWTDFGAAELNADNEANSLANVYRVAAGLPESIREARSKCWPAITPTRSLRRIGRRWPPIFTPEATEKSTRTCGRR